VIYVPEASARTLDNRRPRVRSSPRSRPRRPAAPRPEGAPGGLSASLAPSCTQRSDVSAQRSLACPADPGIRLSVGCALIIPMIIQTIRLDPSRADWTDEASNVSRLDPSGSDQIDAEHPSRNRKGDGPMPLLDCPCWSGQPCYDCPPGCCRTS
jgi:hypothetical protein